MKNKKQIILKLIHVIGYICTFIVIAFSIILGVQSCNNDKQDNRQSKPINNAVYVGNLGYIGLSEINSPYFYFGLINYYKDNGFTAIGDNGVTLNNFLNNSTPVYWDYNDGDFRLGYYDKSQFNGFSPFADAYKIRTAWYKITRSDSYNVQFTASYIFQNGSETLTYNGYIHYSDAISSWDDELSTPFTYNGYFNLWNNNTQYAIRYNTTNQRGCLPPVISGTWSDAYNEGYDRGHIDGEYEGYQNGFQDGFDDAMNTSKEVTQLPYNYDFRNWISKYLDDNGLMNMSVGISPTQYVSKVYYNILIKNGDNFKVNGTTYNGVVLRVMSVMNDTYVKTSEGNITKARDIYGDNALEYGLLDVHYVYTNDNADGRWHNINDTYDGYKDYIYDAEYYVLVVNGYDIQNFNNNGSSSHYYDFNKYEWLSPVFRELIDYQDTNNSVYTPSYNNGFTLYQLFIYNDYGFINDNVATTNVFNLLTSAFSSLTGILSIAILPNITIGILLFIPLIATIVLFIIKLLRK